MKCPRPGCPETEDRIDGYCSIYCRDMEELRLDMRGLIVLAILRAWQYVWENPRPYDRSQQPSERDAAKGIRDQILKEAGYFNEADQG